MRWAPMNVEDALELLSPTFTHPKVRKYAITRLRQTKDEVRSYFYCITLRPVVYGVSDLVPDGTNLWLFQIRFQYILTR